MRKTTTKKPITKTPKRVATKPRMATNRVALQVTIPPATKAKLVALAKAKNISMGDVIATII